MPVAWLDALRTMNYQPAYLSGNIKPNEITWFYHHHSVSIVLSVDLLNIDVWTGCQMGVDQMGLSIDENLQETVVEPRTQHWSTSGCGNLVSQGYLWCICHHHESPLLSLRLESPVITINSGKFLQILPIFPDFDTGYYSNQYHYISGNRYHVHRFTIQYQPLCYPISTIIMLPL